jgi:hypothetical protein
MHQPNDIPLLVKELDVTSSLIAATLGETLTAIHLDAQKEKGCSFASNMILHASSKLFSTVLSFVAMHNHGEGEEKLDEKVNHSIASAVSDLIGEVLQKHGSRDGSVLLSIKVDRKGENS